MKRILLGQLGVYGDCLNATIIARQIKLDHPDCHLTWGIGSKYADILKNNPYVDTVWEYPVASRWEVTSKWYAFAKEAQDRKDRREFDEIYLTQAYPGNPDLFYGSPRESMFRVYPHTIEFPLEMDVILSPEEINNVETFAKRLTNYKHVILFECSPESGQSFVTSTFALTVAELITTQIPNSCVIMSGNKPVQTDNPNIIDASVLTFRENAELVKYCTLFIGTGSGITQIVQTAPPLPMILLLDKRTVASLICDRNYFAATSFNIIEMTKCDAYRVFLCVQDALRNGISTAKKTYCDTVTPDYTIIRFHMRFDKARREGDYIGIFIALAQTIQEYGLTWELGYFFYTFPESIGKLISRKLRGIN